MKKIFNILLLAATALGLTTSCSDVPSPYDINGEGNTSFGRQLPYKSTNLNTGWVTRCISENEPWSQGSSYTQATGYQDWDGTGSKYNKEVESYLISPAINTTCESGKVKICFDQTIRYFSNVPGWEKYHKVLISKRYNNHDFNAEDWEELPYKPVASPYESGPREQQWTLYSSGDIQIPDAYVNSDSVFIAFYFYAPASNSTTWELENFYILEGEAGTNPDDPDNPTPTEGEGSGTAEDPYNVAATIALVSALPADTNSDPVYGSTEGGGDNPDPDIPGTSGGVSIDGTENNAFYIFRTMDIGNQKFTDANKIKKGDKVVIYGPLVNYRGNTPETVGSKTYLISINGEGGGNTPTPTPTEGSGSGTQADPYNVAATIAMVKALPADTNSDPVYITGIICNDPSIDTGQYGNATFKISDDGTDSNSFYIFRTFDIGNQKFTNANKIKKGDKVVIYGPLVNYKGNTPETVASKTYLISINGSTEGGGDNPDPDIPGTSGGVSIDGTTVTLTNTAATAGSESITIDLATLGLENAAEMGTVTLSDGTTIVFDAGSNRNAPKYYSATNGARVYANNTITFNGKSPIAKVVMTCDSYNGTDYVGNATATIAVSGNTLVYTNASSDAGTQLRVQTITITYAQ